MVFTSPEINAAGLIAAVEQAADGIVITGTSGIIQYVNPAFTAMTGYTAEEAVGQHTRMLKSGRQDPGVYGSSGIPSTRGGIWHGELDQPAEGRNSLYRRNADHSRTRLEGRHHRLHRDQTGRN